MSEDLVNLGDETVAIFDDDGDTPADKLLCGQIGRRLSEVYPGWDWLVEVPPGQNIIVIRNLTCDPRGTMGMVRHRDKWNGSTHEIVMAAGEFLERYRMRRARINHEVVRERGEMLFQSPET